MYNDILLRYNVGNKIEIIGEFKMKKQNVGFAFLLLGLIFAVPADSLLWWIGALLGFIGLIIVIINSKAE